MQTAPMIFQVRSSFASFFRSIFSSFSGFRSVAAGFGFSLSDFLVFFSLLAMETKIINWGKWNWEILELHIIPNNFPPAIMRDQNPQHPLKVVHSPAIRTRIYTLNLSISNPML